LHIIIKRIYILKSKFSSYQRQNSNHALTRTLVLSQDQTALFAAKMLKPDFDSTRHQIEYQETVPSGT